MNGGGDGAGGEEDELAALLAAWREDIDSVPAPAMLVLEAALTLHAASLVLSSGLLR
ncbi:anti-sigma-D factor RsdA [Actinosynnema sp. NPDC051121]